MSVSDSEHRASALGGAKAFPNESAPPRPNPRPQRLRSWFTLLPVKEFEDTRPAKVDFLDSFVTIERNRSADGANAQPYTVLFEGQRSMSVVVNYGLIFVWYGEDLLKPDRPFPTLFAQPYESQYVSSKVCRFRNTHVMDFVENGSDNLHFAVVHLWESSKIYDHKISVDTITLKQDIRMRYAASAGNPIARLISRLLPTFQVRHDYVYHGPGLATVAPQGYGKLQIHNLVSLTPEGSHGTRVYVTIAIDPATFPRWVERLFHIVSPRRALCDLFAGILANFVHNEFDVDAVIWANKKFDDMKLLPAEQHLYGVRRWGETFYPKDFVAPSVNAKPREEMRWEYLDEVSHIEPGKVHPYRVAGENVVAWADVEGRVHVYDAYCPHQGAHLGHGGTLTNGCVRCPFHGFHFDAAGRCLGPNPESRTKALSDLDLTPIQQRIEGGRLDVFV